MKRTSGANLEAVAAQQAFTIIKVDNRHPTTSEFDYLGRTFFYAVTAAVTLRSELQF